MNEIPLIKELEKSKELIKDIRWNLTSLLSQQEIQDENYLNLTSEYLKVIDKINSNLNVFRRNISILENYMADFEEMKNNQDYLRIYNIKSNSVNSEAEKYIGNSIRESLNEFYSLDFLEVLSGFKYNDLSAQDLNVYQKLFFDLDFIVKKNKETILQLKPKIENYRNNIKMLPVFESSKKTIETNLLKYIDNKKSEIDRYFKSIQDEFSSLSGKFENVDKDLDVVKKSYKQMIEEIPEIKKV
ncbi:hypothetical protein [Acinetobacter guillouiae]|uniref:hypothetical protein n=1 Tax=Acinetobacter guillouiae TaxID=106649 RepID=UPI00333ED398